MFQRFAQLGWVSFWLVAAQADAWAQKPTVIPLVPAANWRLINSQAADLNSVRQWGGDPVIDREYGVKSAEVRSYQLEDQTVQALVEETSDASSAYGLLTYYQTEAMAPEKTMQLTLAGPEGALMARGRYFIRVSRPGGGKLTENEFRALLIFLGGTRPSAQATARLPAPMPQSGMIPGSEKYLVGLEAARRVLPTFRTDLIGFPQGAEVQVASYQIGKARPTVVAINYPTPQIARVRFGAMERFLGINQDRGQSSLFGKRLGSFVFLVLGAESATTAGKLMDEIQLSSSVSWDRRYPGEKPITMQVVELILANIALTLILVGAAIVGGILLFLSRMAAAKWFPDSPWGHPDEGTIIKLNLSQR